ncbi:MAG: hypothetical protein KAS66_07055 [Candidatus Omnitrophica bacterium]|nr:hypothetical protein [Candidatus Omnitrophota bacterium]
MPDNHFITNLLNKRFGRILSLLSLVFGLWSVAGCQNAGGNVGQVHSYSIAAIEAKWIRDGEPADFEDELWYPVDNIEIFLDSEMSLSGEYQGVQLFTDKVDVRPFDRLYTKFGRNKFRIFEKRTSE